jgi:hypothetical protein
MHDDFGDYAITNMTQQRHHQHDSKLMSHNSLIININNI